MYFRYDFPSINNFEFSSKIILFLRIAIEASLEQSNGAKPELPFWRVIDRNSSLIKKLPISEKYLTELKSSEGLK